MINIRVISVVIILLFFFPQYILSKEKARTSQESASNFCAQKKTQTVVQWLSETCLYENIGTYQLARELSAFTPNFQLWSDGASKLRWVYIPDHQQINSNDPDNWVFPVGTQFFKEFQQVITLTDGTQKNLRVETRHLIKTNEGIGKNAWSIATYAWLADQSDAQLSQGASNVIGTLHDIPSQKDCIICHKGNKDFILGFDAIQLSDALRIYAQPQQYQKMTDNITLTGLMDQHRLTKGIDPLPMLPGTIIEKKALGYLHSNCGNCHNPLGHASEREAEHLIFKHQLAFSQLQETDVYKTAVNKKTRNFTFAPFIVMGGMYEALAVFKSAIFIRMNSLDEDYRMPMMDSEVIDYEGVNIIHQWILSIETPEDDYIVE